MKAVISPDVTKDTDVEFPDQRYCAVLFRNCVYVATPRHMDAINLAFAGMTDHQKRRISWRIADGKESILFGFARSDGTGWELAESQDGRKIMYGFD